MERELSQIYPTWEIRLLGVIYESIKPSFTYSRDEFDKVQSACTRAKGGVRMTLNCLRETSTLDFGNYSELELHSINKNQTEFLLEQ